MALEAEIKAQIMKEYATFEGDTGSQYLWKTDIQRYRTLIQRLGLRR